MAADLDALARRFSLGAAEFTTSPLYQRLCGTVAANRELRAIVGDQRTTEHLALVDGHADWMARLDG